MSVRHPETTFRPDLWMPLREWTIGESYRYVWIGQGNYQDGEQEAMKRLDQLERRPFATLAKWAATEKGIMHRVKRLNEREEVGTVHANIENERGETVYGRVRLVARDPSGEQSHIFDEWDAIALSNGVPRRWQQPALSSDYTLVAQFRPLDREVDLDPHHTRLSVPVTTVRDRHGEIEVETTTAQWGRMR